MCESLCAFFLRQILLFKFWIPAQPFTKKIASQSDDGRKRQARSRGAAHEGGVTKESLLWWCAEREWLYWEQTHRFLLRPIRQHIAPQAPSTAVPRTTKQKQNACYANQQWQDLNLVRNFMFPTCKSTLGNINDIHYGDPLLSWESRGVAKKTQYNY